MPRFRLSIAQIMLVVLVVGGAIAALRSPSPLLASVVWTSTAILLCWAATVGLVSRGRRSIWARVRRFRLGSPCPDLPPAPA